MSASKMVRPDLARILIGQNTEEPTATDHRLRTAADSIASSICRAYRPRYKLRALQQKTLDFVTAVTAVRAQSAVGW